MKVLVISHSCTIDINQQVFAALEALPGMQLTLLVPANWKSEYTGAPLQAKPLVGAGFAFLPTPVQKPGSVALHFYPRLPWDDIRKFAPDAVLSQQEPYSLSGGQALHIARRLRVPLLFQTNQNILKRYPPPFGWIESATYKTAACALAYSEEARQVMLQKGRAEPTSVVPYATDITRFAPRALPGETKLRTDLQLAGTTVIGYLGRLVPEKGLDTLIDAAAKLRDANAPPFKILLVGGGAQKADLEQQVQAHNLRDQVVWVDAVPHDEAARYMACLDIFVLPSRTTPSWKEQFGRVIIESLACEVPVVGSDSGAIPHLIAETGGGLVFAEGDADELAVRLSTLLLNPDERRALGKQGAAIVRSRFSCEAVARTLRDLLHRAAGVAPAPLVEAT